MRIRRHWRSPSPPPSSVGSSNNLLPHEDVQEVTSPVVHTCATWGAFFWACQLSDAPDEHSDNRGILRKRKKLRAAELAQLVMAKFSRDQDETPALGQRKVYNYFIKEGCSMERPNCTSKRMSQVQGQAMQNDEKIPSLNIEGEAAEKKGKGSNLINTKNMPSSSKFDAEDNEERKKRRRMSY